MKFLQLLILLNSKLFVVSRACYYLSRKRQNVPREKDIFTYITTRPLNVIRVKRAKFPIHPPLGYIMLIMLHRSDIISLSNISLDN